MRGLIGAACAFALSACSAREISLYLPLPPHEGAKSIVLASESSGALVDVTAADLDPTRATITLSAAALGGGDTAQLFALVYDSDLAALKLPTGAVPKVSADRADARALPTADTRWSATLDLTGDEAPAWQSSSALSAAVDRFRTEPASTPCAQFDVNIRTLETNAHGMFLIAIDQETMLAGFEDGRIFRLSHDGTHAEVNIFSAVLNAPHDNLILGAFYDGTHLWLGNAAGELDRASFDGQTITVEERWFDGSADATLHWITGYADTGGTELFVLSTQGRLERFDGRVFHTLRAENPLTTFDTRGGLATINRHEVVAVIATNPTVLRVKDGVLSEELVPQDGALHVVAQLPGLGTVVGTSEGQFFRREASGWEIIAGSPLAVWSLGIHPYEDGFVYSGSFDNLGQYKPSYDENHGYCPLTMPTGFEGRYFASVGEDLLMVGDNPSVPMSPYVILRRRR